MHNPAASSIRFSTHVTRIVKVLRIAVMGGKFFQVMVPLEDIVEFMNANMVRIKYGVSGLSNTCFFILYFIIVREGKISGTIAARGLKFWL